MPERVQRVKRTGFGVLYVLFMFAMQERVFKSRNRSVDFDIDGIADKNSNIIAKCQITFVHDSIEGNETCEGKLAIDVLQAP